MHACRCSRQRAGRASSSCTLPVSILSRCVRCIVWIISICSTAPPDARLLGMVKKEGGARYVHGPTGRRKLYCPCFGGWQPPCGSLRGPTTTRCGEDSVSCKPASLISAAARLERGATRMEGGGQMQIPRRGRLDTLLGCVCELN
jgi:hypothetical protein